MIISLSYPGEYPYCGLKLCLRRGEPGSKANGTDGSTRVAEPGVIENIVQKVRTQL